MSTQLPSLRRMYRVLSMQNSSVSLQVPEGGALKSLRRYSHCRRLDVVFDYNGYIDLKCLSECPSLREFCLYRGTLTGAYGIEYCSVLETISFWGADLRGVDLSILGQLPKLVRFTLVESYLDRNSSLGQSESLRQVELVDPWGIDDLRMFEGIRLTHLSIKQSQFESLEGICVDELVALDAYNNSIVSLAPLRGAQKLRTLVLTHNRVGSIDDIMELEELTTLYLCGNPIENRDSVSELSRRLEVNYFHPDGLNVAPHPCSCGWCVDVMPGENEDDEECLHEEHAYQESDEE